MLFAGEPEESLWAAARQGDVKAIESLLAKGVDVNAKTHYGATALWFAAYKSRLDAVKFLIAHKADLNAADSVWGGTPLGLAVEEDNAAIVKVLLEAGATNADAALLAALNSGSSEVVRTLLEKGRIKTELLSAALVVTPPKRSEIVELLKKGGAKPAGSVDFGYQGQSLTPFTGVFESPNGLRYNIAVKDGLLVGRSDNGGVLLLQGTGTGEFQPLTRTTTIIFERKGGRITGFVLREGKTDLIFERTVTRQASSPKLPQPAEETGTVLHAKNWPSFRGDHGSGVADGQFPPTSWDVEKGRNIRWKTPIPGLAHSSPIVWGDRVFVTTAVSGADKTEFKPGLYGAGTSAADVTKHSWRLYCLDKQSGKILWDRTAHEGVPKIKRHIKSSHANPTPASDGKHVVAYFASEGLFCYDLDGKLHWKQDLGLIDVGAFNDPDLQWGVASSPILYKNLVIIQCDRHKDSFIAAFDLDNGKPAWRTPRDEIPSWATPTVCEDAARPELIVNGTKHICGYDPQTGRELWRLAGNSEITVPVPVVGSGLIFVTSGYRPIQPIYAIWPGATGDITLKEGADSNERIAWSKQRGGPYMPSAIVYQGYYYTCSNSGMLNCYEARTGKQVYRQRLGGTGGTSASPVAADGKLYFTSEDGDIRVVKAGPNFEMLAVNKMGDFCMATPAIADGMIFVRSQHYLSGIGRTAAAK